MAIPLDPKQIFSFEGLLMSQVVQQEALTRRGVLGTVKCQSINGEKSEKDKEGGRKEAEMYYDV